MKHPEEMTKEELIAEVKRIRRLLAGLSLEDLFGLLTTTLGNAMIDGTATPAHLGVARQHLKDNNITATKENKDLQALQEALKGLPDFTDDDDNVHYLGNKG